jgi:hypothetical protein
VAWLWLTPQRRGAVVNGAVHSEISAVPAERLVTERELLGPLPSLPAAVGRVVTRNRPPVARAAGVGSLLGVGGADRAAGQPAHRRLLVISANTEDVAAKHILIPPDKASVRDERYGAPQPNPRWAVRPRTVGEKEFCRLGPVTGTSIWLSTIKAASMEIKVRLHDLRHDHASRLQMSGVASDASFLVWREGRAVRDAGWDPAGGRRPPSA